MIRRLFAFVAASKPRRPRPARTVPDIPITDPSPQQVAELRALCGDWFLMWSRYRRTWTAIATFGVLPVIVDDRDPRRLVRQCREIELAAAYS